MADTPRLDFPYIAQSQAQKEVTHNEALDRLDALVQTTAIDRDLNAPPGSPVEGDVYIVGTAPTGAWAGRAKDITEYIGATWKFYDPDEGWISYLKDENMLVVYDGANWVTVGSMSGTTFLALTDTPSDYAEDALKLVRVNAAETALEFTDSPTVANLTATGNVEIDGRLGIGGAPSTNAQLLITGAFTGATVTRGLVINTTLTSPVGQTMIGMNFAGTLVEAASGVHPVIAFMGIAGGFTDGGATTDDFRSLSVSAVGGTLTGVTRGTTVYVSGAPTGATTNLAMWIDAGQCRFDDSISIGAGAPPDSAAILDLSSTSKALLVPRMTTAQRDAIASPPDGLVLYDSTVKALTVRDNAAWVELAVYDVGGSFAGTPTASATIMRYPFPHAATFPASLTLSQGVAGTAPSAQTDFDLRKNGVSFGTMRFAASATTATFIAASETSFVAGDVLTVVAPATLNGIADLGWGLAARR